MLVAISTTETGHGVVCAPVPVARFCEAFRRTDVGGWPIRKLDGFYRFAGQIGSLDSRGRLTVRLEIFARLTPVALDESQIEAA